MKKLFFTLSLIQAVVLGYAQTSLRPGYIVITDTIRGAVVYHEGAQATRICSFKKEGTSESVDYRPGDIKGYGFESRHFTSIVYKGNVQFMEVIATGRIRLLRSNKVFYLVKDTTIVPLTSEKKGTVINGRHYDSEDKVWLGRVKPMLNDCQATVRALDGVQLSSLSPKQVERKFSKVIAQYNECYGEKTTVYKLEKTKRPVSIGFFTGVAIPTAKFTSPSSTERYTGSAGPVFGVSFEWANLRISERLKFRTEVLYSKVEADGTNQYGLHRSMKYSAVKVPLLIHYSFSSGRVVPFVRAGVACNFLFDSQYVMTYPGIDHESSKFTRFTLPVLVAGGLETPLSRKLRGYVEVRYESPSTIYLDRRLRDKIRASQVAFLVGVRF